jgi:hypothetical protein
MAFRLRYSLKYMEDFSPKFISTILHSPGPVRPEARNNPSLAPNLKRCILWWWIKMRLGE